jgi:membrane protease subunit (stomatin/prohibitin family)
MARRRTVGYVENEWTCPSCDTRNKGSSKTCENCGAPQPENVQFELGAERKLVTDAEKVKAAAAGADVHCAYCGTRNSATAEVCIQCGADLKEGKAREAGRVMQTPAAQPQTLKCDNCGTENPGSNTVCSKCGSPLPRLSQVAAVPPLPKTGLTPAAPLSGKQTSNTRNLFIAGAILACLAVVCVAVIGLFFFPTASVPGTVTDVHWQTSVPVQEIQAVRYNDEQGSPPSSAYNVSCHTEESCTQKTVDKGNGYSEVVEECNDVQYCSYTVDEWQTIQTYSLEGSDLQPVYDDPSIASDQRLGDASEQLTVTFSTDDGTKTYSPDSISEFQQFDIGSSWTLKLNAVGSVLGVE